MHFHHNLLPPVQNQLTPRPVYITTTLTNTTPTTTSNWFVIGQATSQSITYSHSYSHHSQPYHHSQHNHQIYCGGGSGGLDSIGLRDGNLDILQL